MSKRPQIINNLKQMFDACSLARGDGKTVSLVPTMGALHAGHLKLIDRAAQEGDLVVVSIFVNPTQFGAKEDLNKYPRDFKADVNKLATQGVTDIVFAPSSEAMYPPGASTEVSVSGVTQGLCGVCRPGHFSGVATIVSKLFNIMGPCTAIFGRKDYQQLQVIIKMTQDLNMPVRIVGVATVREPDGMAMSSRNMYLSKTERKRALSMAKGFTEAHKLFRSGQRNIGALRRVILANMESNFDKIEYVAAANPTTLQLLSDSDDMEGSLLIAVAAVLGKTRLIDNTVIGEDLPPGKT